MTSTTTEKTREGEGSMPAGTVPTIDESTDAELNGLLERRRELRSLVAGLEGGSDERRRIEARLTALSSRRPRAVDELEAAEERTTLQRELRALNAREEAQRSDARRDLQAIDEAIRVRATQLVTQLAAESLAELEERISEGLHAAEAVLRVRSELVRLTEVEVPLPWTFMARGALANLLRAKGEWRWP